MCESDKKASDFGVTRADFDEWRLPRDGDANPTRMDNPAWEWLIRTRINAYQAVKQMEAEYAIDAGPTWCFDRFGQSSTKMPDGRVIYIAGEHEDYYDPDFCIYNDVVVIGPDDVISIFGYPKNVFPPTDFHSATRVGDSIYIVGSLGYPDARRDAIETVHVLDTRSYAITPRTTTGDLPPWLHSHQATLNASESTIRIAGGLIDRGAGNTFIENLDTWDLDLNTLAWKHLDRLPWMRWEFLRIDRQRNHLWEIRQAQWSRDIGWTKDFRKQIKRLASKLGFAPHVKAIRDIYRPRVAHDFMGADEERYDTYRISVDGVVVRFVESSYSVQMTIEGELPDALAQMLVEDVRRKLSGVEGVEYSVEPIRHD